MSFEFVNPFIQSVASLFETMLGCKVQRGDIGCTQSPALGHEIVARVGLSGVAQGTVVLSMPIETALAMAHRFLGSEVETTDGMVSDIVAEMANIIAGGAKAKFYVEGHPIVLGLPRVIGEGESTLDTRAGPLWLEIPFTSELGPFSLRLTLLFHAIACNQ